MRILFILTTTFILACSACGDDDSSPSLTAADECFVERLDNLKDQTRAQDAGSLTVYRHKTTDERYFVYYYAEDRGMLDKGSVTVVDENCEEICTASIMTHWTFCVEDLKMEDVEEVEVIWTND